MMTDPIADMLTRIRNACTAGHAEVVCPSSRLNEAVARVLEAEGFLGAVAVEDATPRQRLRMRLRYDRSGDPVIDGLRRVSRPGRRVYVGSQAVPRVRNGLGVAVISTSRGVVSDRTARESKVGGEVLCEVW